jgi:hypothetical protein
MPSSSNSKELRSVPVINVALKAKYAFYSTLVFFLVANPETFKLTQRILGRFISIASDGGCPTAYGFFAHSIVFFIVLWGMMLFPRDP